MNRGGRSSPVIPLLRLRHRRDDAVNCSSKAAEIRPIALGAAAIALPYR